MIDVAARFGENLAHARERAHIIQEVLSFRASLHRTEVGHLERGGRIPRIDTLVKLRDARCDQRRSARRDHPDPGATFGGAGSWSRVRTDGGGNPQAPYEGLPSARWRALSMLGGGIGGLALSRHDDEKISKTFRTESEAKSWRAKAKRSLDRGTLRAPGQRTIREAGETWLAGAERGEIRSRSGRPFKSSSLRGYQQAFTDRIVPAVRHCKVSALTASDLQKLVDDWQAEGHAASTIRNYLRPLQAIYRRARAREGVPVNPTRDLELPVPERREVEIVTPGSAATLLAVLPNPDRAIWATALYAGLRSGELRALRWEAIDVAKRIIEVRESWDPKEGSIEPKTRRSRRRVPMPSILRELLIAQQARSELATESALVFGENDKTPFQPERLYRNADSVWHHAGIRERLRLHQARHTYASFMIAAGINAKAPGSEAEGAALLDAYLDGRPKDIEETDE